MNNDDGKFSTGFILGLVLGGGLVFLLGTRTGKNLLKIISEQGLDGLANLLEDYDLEEEEENLSAEEVDEPVVESSNGHKKEAAKKRFFKRLKR